MKKTPSLKNWSTKQAIAILAVDNIKVSAFGVEILKQVEDGLISHEEAKKSILDRAKAKSLTSTTNKKPVK